MSRVLFLSRWFPYPPSNGSKLRIFNLLRGLAQHHEVTLLSFFVEPPEDMYPEALTSICQEVVAVPWRPFVPGRPMARLGLLSATPRSVLDTHSPEMEEHVRERVATGGFDLVIASEIDTAGYIGLFSQLPSLFEAVELGLIYEQAANAPTRPARLRKGLTWSKHRRYLARLLCQFNVCTVASVQEQQLLERALTTPVQVEVIPNCMHLPDYTDVQATPRPNSLIFAGSFTYHVNHDAMVWFLREVYPRILVEVPGTNLTITGYHADLPLPAAANLNLTGLVDDVRPWVAGSTVSVVPLLEGGGTRLKILEAMALGTPVVATSKGAEGLEALDGQHLLIADRPEAFADAVVRLFNDLSLRQYLATNAIQLVTQHYDWRAVMPRFLTLVDQIIGG